MGACSVTITNNQYFGGLRATVGTLTLSNSYAANGDTLAASAFGLSSVSVLIHDYHRNGIMFMYDYTNGKMKAYFPTGGTDTAPSVVTTAPLTKSGASSATAVDATRPNLTPGVGKEVAATADVSGITLYFVAIGY